MITGYPPEDLLLKPSFIRDNRAALERVVAASKGIAVVVGFVNSEGNQVYNAARGGPQRQTSRRLPQGLPTQLRRL